MELAHFPYCNGCLFKLWMLVQVNKTGPCDRACRWIVQATGTARHTGLKEPCDGPVPNQIDLMRLQHALPRNRMTTKMPWLARSCCSSAKSWGKGIGSAPLRLASFSISAFHTQNRRPSTKWTHLYRSNLESLDASQTLKSHVHGLAARRWKRRFFPSQGST